MRENPQVDLTPNDAESELITNLKTSLAQVDQDNPVQDDILIGYITDTHFSSYKTPGTVRALRQMKLMSYIAHEVGLDLVVNGGDLNDGAAPSNWEMDDIKRAVDATMLGRRPFIILQGNHDDDSGFARDDNHDENGYWPDNIIHNDVANTIRLSKFQQYLNVEPNANNALYGTYKIPNSKVNVVVLDGFDQPDDYGDLITSRTSFRHGWPHFSVEQQNWLKSTLDTIQSNGEKALIFTHIMFHGQVWQSGQPNDFAEIKQSDGSFYPNVFEGGNIKDIIENHASSVIGVFGGHTHRDDSCVEGGVTYLTTTCALPDRGDGQEARTINTNTEPAFDILQIKPGAKKLFRHRVGWSDPSYFVDQIDFSKPANWEWLVDKMIFKKMGGRVTVNMVTCSPIFWFYPYWLELFWSCWGYSRITTPRP